MEINECKLAIDEKNISKSVLNLALPAVAEQTLFMIVGVVSTIFVGQIGKEAISAVGLINTLTNFIFVVFVALSTGCTVLVARLIGEQDSDGARDAVRQSVALALVSSFVVSIICYFLSYSMLQLFFGKADHSVITSADIYFKITLYTLPLTLINTIISGTLRGAGDTKTPMIIAAIVNILNVILNWYLIFGGSILFLTIPGMGIIGSAWAVAISRGAGGILSIVVILTSRNIIRLDLKVRFKVSLELIRRIFHIGIPAALEQVVMQGGFLVLQVVIAGMGTTAIAVYQVGMSINSICFIPVWGFGIAATTITGQCLGASKANVAEKSGWTAIKIAQILTAVLTVSVFIFAKQLVGIYSKDPEVIRVGTNAIRIFSISQPFLSLVVVISGALRGAGDILYVMVTSFVGIWVFRIALSIIIDYLFHLGIISVWIALCFDFFVRSMMYMVRYKRGRWKQIAI